ncbi:MAG: hypothetical protein JW966_16030 [Anaerolineae bacterium]|nr:hypothetical protein [Anaerolineae bacterium]
MVNYFYPDILGTLSDDRLTIEDVMQCALGIFPAATALGQPAEALLLLQNLTDQPLDVQMAVQLPQHDRGGNLVNIFTPKPRLKITLPAAEIGILHIPVTPHPPTQLGATYDLSIDLTVEKPDRLNLVRPPSGGHQPNLLSISPFRLAVLRDITFSAKSRHTNQINVSFDVLSGRFPPRSDEPMPRYEALWTISNLEQEEAKAQEMAGEALRFAHSLTRQNAFEPLLQRTKDVFGDGGMPLHPGEAMFISKVLTYVIEDGLDLEPGFSLVDGNWFKRLCWLMAHTPDALNNTDHLINLLYSAVMRDAVMVGFWMVGQDTKADFGDEQERLSFTNRLIAAVEGRRPFALEHVYVPLVMSGTLMTARMAVTGENPWHSLNLLREARNGRVRLADASFQEVFDILDRLMNRAERLLREMQIPRE